MTIEPHNHRQIEQLNQPSGRTLSIVDLIQAGHRSHAALDAMPAPMAFLGKIVDSRLTSF